MLGFGHTTINLQFAFNREVKLVPLKFSYSYDQATGHVSRGTQQQRLLARYAEHSHLLGWVLVFFAALVIGMGVYVGGGWGVFISAVGGALMPAALVNAWLDPLLREDAARDMKALLDIRADLDATGFLAAWRTPAFDVRTFVGRTNEIAVLPLNLREWMNRDYATLLDLCAASAVSLRVYLSAPDEPWCTVLAHRDNREPETVRNELIRLPDQLLRAWDASRPHAGSEVEIFFFDGVPSTGITLCDGGAAIEVGPAVRDEEVKVPGHVLSFDSRSDVDVWARRQFSFGNGQRPPTSAGLRPLPPTPQSPKIAHSASGVASHEINSTSLTDPVSRESATSEARDGDDTK